MNWTKLLTPAWIGKSGAAKILQTTEADIEKRVAEGEFVTRAATPNVQEIKFHKTDGDPKYIVAHPSNPPPLPPKA